MLDKTKESVNLEIKRKLDWERLAGFYLWDKGDICIFREVFGRIQVLKLVHQHHYKEWQGCFSIYNNARGGN
jgi:hypothetical protein